MKKRRSRGMFKTKKEKRQYELLSGVSTAAASILIVSIFLLTSLDKILLRSNEYASVIAAVLVDMANSDRTVNNLHGLTLSPALVAAAQAKAEDMAAKSYFAHTSPEGKDPWYWFKQAGYNFAYAGENLAVDFSDSGDVNTAWMNSPSHRENLLDPHFTEVGIATAYGFYQGHPTVFVVQEFGTPSAHETARVAVTSTTPTEPTTPAIASARPAISPPQVLGEQSGAPKKAAAAAVTPVVKPVPTPITVSVRPSTEKPQKVASDWWHLLASPKSALYIAYYVIAGLILLALAIDTGLQIRLHHERKAITAGLMLVLVVLFVITANVFLFPSPIVPSGAAMTAAAAGAL
jgi:hypothetical protein